MVTWVFEIFSDDLTDPYFAPIYPYFSRNWTNSPLVGNRIGNTIQSPLP